MIDLTGATTWWTNFVIVFLIFFALALLFRGLEALLKRTKSPTRIVLLTALESYIKEALAGAATLAEGVLADGQAKLEAADKKAIADKFYTLLPPAILVDGVLLPIGQIKRVVTQAEWETLVAAAASELDAKISQNEAWLKSQVGKLTG